MLISNFVWRAKLNPIEKLVLLFLCESADYYGRADISLNLVGHVCSITEDKAADILRILESKEYIVLGKSNNPNREVDPWISVLLVGAI